MKNKLFAYFAITVTIALLMPEDLLAKDTYTSSGAPNNRSNSICYMLFKKAPVVTSANENLIFSFSDKEIVIADMSKSSKEDMTSIDLSTAHPDLKEFFSKQNEHIEEADVIESQGRLLYLFLKKSTQQSNTENVGTEGSLNRSVAIYDPVKNQVTVKSVDNIFTQTNRVNSVNGKKTYEIDEHIDLGPLLGFARISSYDQTMQSFSDSIHINYKSFLNRQIIAGYLGAIKYFYNRQATTNEIVRDNNEKINFSLSEVSIYSPKGNHTIELKNAEAEFVNFISANISNITDAKLILRNNKAFLMILSTGANAEKTIGVYDLKSDYFTQKPTDDLFRDYEDTGESMVDHRGHRLGYEKFDHQVLSASTQLGSVPIADRVYSKAVEFIEGESFEKTLERLNGNLLDTINYYYSKSH